MDIMKNVLTVSDCAYDCVPANLSISYAKGELFEKMDCCINDSIGYDDNKSATNEDSSDVDRDW